MKILWGGKKAYSDIEVVEGLQRRDAKVEEWFYRAAKRYFDSSFNDIFFDKDSRQEIFQTSFIKLWTEIENGRIRGVDGAVCRQQHSGVYEPMTCSLTTFLMAFARTEFRELVRDVNESGWNEVYDPAVHDAMFAIEGECDDVDEMKTRIVDECIARMSPSCVEILTMFYYKGMGLDEILAARGENTSKDGLKTAKNKCLKNLKEKVAGEFMNCNINV